MGKHPAIWLAALALTACLPASENSIARPAAKPTAANRSDTTRIGKETGKAFPSRRNQNRPQYGGMGQTDGTAQAAVSEF